MGRCTERRRCRKQSEKMDCRCRELSPFFCEFLLAVGESEKDCCHVFEQCRLSQLPFGKPLGSRRTFLMGFERARNRRLYLVYQ